MISSKTKPFYTYCPECGRHAQYNSKTNQCIICDAIAKNNKGKTMQNQSSDKYKSLKLHRYCPRHDGNQEKATCVCDIIEADNKERTAIPLQTLKMSGFPCRKFNE